MGPEVSHWSVGRRSSVVSIHTSYIDIIHVYYSFATLGARSKNSQHVC